jgi:outer membrane protein TolC
LDAKSRYFKSYKAHEDYKLANAELERYKSLVLPDVQARRAKGFASQLDVMKAEVALASNELKAKTSKEAMNSADKELMTITGLDVAPPVVSVEPDNKTIKALVNTSVDDLVKVAVDKRLDMAKAKNDVERARMAAEKSKASLRPSIGVGANVNSAVEVGDPKVDFNAGIGNIFSDGSANASVSVSRAWEKRDKLGWNVNLSFALPTFFDGGVAKRDAENASIAYQDAIKSSEKAKQSISDDVVSSYNALSNAWASWELSALNAKIDELSLKEAKTKLNAGLITKLAYEEQVAQIEANRIQRIQTGHDLILAYDKLNMSLGD